MMVAMSFEPAGIVLAAGYSSRMVAFKPLLPLAGRPLVLRCLDGLAAAGITRVVVVVGHRADEIEAALAGRDCRVVRNPDFDRGMFTSVVAGIGALDGTGARAALLWPVDLPMIRPHTVAAVARAYAADPDPRRVVVPAFRGLPGHPPLIGADHFPGILAWSGQRGLRGYLDAAGGEERLAVADRGVLLDLDTPGDFEAAQARMVATDNGGLPEPEECLALYEHNVRDAGRARLLAHAREVGRLAYRLGSALIAAGVAVDLREIVAAALLHDVAKGQPEHWLRGAAIVTEAGYARLAEAVARHGRLGEGPADALTLCVYLADKCALGDTHVPLAGRFDAAARKYVADPAALAGVAVRRAEADTAARHYSELAGRDFAQVVFTSVAGEDAALEGFRP